MARVKRTITQRDFSRMEVREDFLEGDDLELRAQSLMSAQNMRALASRGAEVRPGTFYSRTLSTARDVVEIRPASGLTYGLLVNDTSLEILDVSEKVVATLSPVPWADASTVWVEGFRSKTVIGGAWGLYVLTYDAGSWSLAPFAFEPSAGGELAQPYWAFEQEITVQPSALTGTITLTASSGIWTEDHVGLRIRYGQREIAITERVSSTVLRGNVVSKLPPSFDITVSDASEYRIGEAVLGADTGYAGVIVGIAGNVLKVVTVSFFEGPDNGEVLAGPSAAATVASSVQVTPYPSVIWDEPLMSAVRGWPRSASAVSGRLVLLDFEAVPDVVALSSVRGITDFAVGLEDDDAIVRQIGDNAPRWLHAVNAGDLLLFAEEGCYLVPTRDNGLMTPATFNAVKFDDRGAAPVRPVRVDDGVVFLESSRQSVAAALLDGNVYLKWSVRSLTTLHHHLIRSPVKLCGPALNSDQPEKYVFVVNGDGTLAAVSWEERIGAEVGRIGFAPWVTDGSFVSVSPLFGEYYAIVDRNGQRLLERFDEAAVLDSAVLTEAPSALVALDANGTDLDVNGDTLTVFEPLVPHLANKTVAIGTTQWHLDGFQVDGTGTVIDEPELAGPRQIGLRFTSRVKPWPVEVIDSARAGMLKARVIRVSISVQATAGFTARMNGHSQSVGGYAFGDDLSAPPPLKTQVYRFSVFGSRHHPDIEFIKENPGAFRVLAITQEVQA